MPHLPSLESPGYAARLLGPAGPAGDVNRDGVEDFSISSFRLRSTYIVFGRKDFSGGSNLSISDVMSIQITVPSPPPLRELGTTTVNAGDINGDGIDDLLIGDAFADPYNLGAAGTIYVVFGGKFDATPAETPTAIPTLTRTPTPPGPSGFHGWILSGDGEVREFGEREDEFDQTIKESIE